jgi:hypothetical protein
MPRVVASKWSWLKDLGHQDHDELRSWVGRIGIERVARIVASLADSNGERGQPGKPDSLLLLKVTHLLLQNPKRRLHSAATEVAKEAHPFRTPRISLENLASKLERDFREHRHAWRQYAKSKPMPSTGEIEDDGKRRHSVTECRALIRIIKSLPSAIDAFDWLYREAKGIGPAEAKLVKALGRERVEPLLTAAFQRQQGPSPPFMIVHSNGKRVVPRTFYDLVEPDLVRLSKDLIKPERRTKA